ncbi:MAG: Type 1 glutamine amidotransferase-like domain-containing protein [Lachnospiraceae bacterium]|nr:Type 1 glutamine amidotransferase-like domain-containing protein [Lachnospiraceae bacterium]
MRSNMYLLAGGRGSDTESLLRAAFAETGKEHPSIAYIGTANGEDRAFMRYLEETLKPAGAGEVHLVRLLGFEKGSEEAHKILKGSDLIFISGGEVEDGMNGLSKDIRVLLRELYELGKVFVSISAGTIMLGIAWPHWDDEDNHPEDAWLFDCLGFASTIFDTHCEWEDWVELRKAVELSPEGFTGYGIPTGGMVLIRPDGTLQPTIPLDAYRSENGEAVYIGKFDGTDYKLSSGASD